MFLLIYYNVSYKYLITFGPARTVYLSAHLKGFASMAEFVQLHNHTEYSLLDGMLRISSNHKPSQFLQDLAAQGIPAMAMTDHGNMYGALDFYDTGRAAGIKPIIGCEF